MFIYFFYSSEYPLKCMLKLKDAGYVSLRQVEYLSMTRDIYLV
jgi:hypothetical protein